MNYQLPLLLPLSLHVTALDYWLMPLPTEVGLHGLLSSSIYGVWSVRTPTNRGNFESFLVFLVLLFGSFSNDPYCYS